MRNTTKNFVLGLIVSSFVFVEYGFLYIILLSMFLVFMNSVDALKMSCIKKEKSSFEIVDVVLNVFFYFLGLFVGLAVAVFVGFLCGFLHLF